MGMHAALQINPYYGKTSKAGLLTHFNAVLNEGPAIIYNVPGRTGQDIADDVVHEIAQHSNFLVCAPQGCAAAAGGIRVGHSTGNSWKEEMHAAAWAGKQEHGRG